MKTRLLPSHVDSWLVKCLATISRASAVAVLTGLWSLGRLAASDPTLNPCAYADYEPILVPPDGCQVDLNGDESVDVRMVIGVQRLTGTIANHFVLRSQGGTDLLVPKPGRQPFRASETVATNALTYWDAEQAELGGDPSAARILAARYYPNDFPPVFRFDFDIAPGVLSFYYGLRQVRDDGLHMGWVHIRWESTNAGAFYRIVDYAYNPVPDVPVVAGVHPPGPELVTTPFDGGIQFSWGLRVGDNPALRLEWTSTLTPPEWRPVEGGTTSPVTLPVGSESAFFRLALPPP